MYGDRFLCKKTKNTGGKNYQFPNIYSQISIPKYCNFNSGNIKTNISVQLLQNLSSGFDL